MVVVLVLGSSGAMVVVMVVVLVLGSLEVTSGSCSCSPACSKFSSIGLANVTMAKARTDRIASRRMFLETICET